MLLNVTHATGEPVHNYIFMHFYFLSIIYFVKLQKCHYLSPNCYNTTSIEQYNMHFYSSYKQYLAFYSTVRYLHSQESSRRRSTKD